MKRINLLQVSTLAALCLCLLCGCSSQNNKKSLSKQNYESSIALNQQEIIIGVNIQKLLTKSNIKNLFSAQDQELFFTGISKEISPSINSQEIIKKALEDPSNSGIDISQNIYFNIYNIDSSSYTTNPKADLFAAVADQNVLSKNLQVILADQGINSNSANTLDGFTCYSVNDINILYNDILLVITEKKGEDLKFLTRPEKNLTESKSYNTFKEGKDIALVMNYKDFIVPGNAGQNFFQQFKDKYNDDILQGLSLNFENGKIKLVQNMYFGENKDQLKDIEQITTRVSQTYSEFIDKDPLLYLNFAINGKYLMKFINKYLIDNSTLDSSDQNIAQQIETEVNKINGDITLGIDNINYNILNNTSQVDFKAFISIADQAGLLKVIDTLKDINTHVLKKGDYYQLSNKQFVCFAGYTPNHIFITSDEGFAANPSKKATESIKQSRYFSQSNEAYSYFILDIKKILNMPLLGMLTASFDESTPALNNLINNVDYLEVKASSATSSEAQLIINDESENSLATITKALLELQNL